MLDPYKRRILKMPDGGSVALDFEDPDLHQDLPADAPVVILLPGEGPVSRASYLHYRSVHRHQPNDKELL